MNQSTVVTGDTPLELHDNAAHEKLKLSEKIRFGISTMVPDPLLSLLTAYLMIFYTDVIKMDPVIVGIMFLVARIADGFSDPIMGYLIDHMPRKKMGKYRYIMIFGIIICCLNYLMLWFGPAWIPQGKVLVAFVTYIILGFTFDLVGIPCNSLLPAITANEKERSSLGKFMGFSLIFANLVVAVLAPIILSAGKLGESAFFTLVLIVVGIEVFCGTFGPLGVKERVIPVAIEIKHNVKDYLRIFTLRPVWSMILFSIIWTIGYYLTTAVNTYFFQYIVGNLSVYATVALMNLVGLVPGLLVSGFFIFRLGRKKVFILATIAMSVMLLIRLLDPTSIPLIMLSTIGMGFIFGVMSPTVQVTNAGNIDYVEYKLNYRSEAAIASVSSFIAKIGNGIGAAIPGFVLGMTGYLPGVAEQPSAVRMGLIAMTMIIPPVLFILASILFGVTYNLDQKTLDTVQATLSDRRGQALENSGGTGLKM